MSEIFKTLQDKANPSIEVYPNIKGDNIPTGAITTPKIADGAITTSKLSDNSITTDKLNNNAVTTQKINDGAITSAKIQDLSITTSKMQDAIITPDKIINEAITTAKVQDGAITMNKLSFGVYPTNVTMVLKDSSNNDYTLTFEMIFGVEPTNENILNLVKTYLGSEDFTQRYQNIVGYYDFTNTKFKIGFLVSWQNPPLTYGLELDDADGNEILKVEFDNITSSNITYFGKRPFITQ